MRYLYIVNRNPNNLSASIPDLPGVGATGRTSEELEYHLAQALALHLYTMADDGDAIPEPTATPEDPELALEPDEKVGHVEPAAINPVSMQMRKLIDEHGLSQREIARRMDISPQALSRLLSPFYFGHSVTSLRQFAGALNRELDVGFPQRPATHQQGNPLGSREAR